MLPLTSLVYSIICIVELTHIDENSPLAWHCLLAQIAIGFAVISRLFYIWKTHIPIKINQQTAIIEKIKTDILLAEEKIQQLHKELDEHKIKIVDRVFYGARRVGELAGPLVGLGLIIYGVTMDNHTAGHVVGHVGKEIGHALEHNNKTTRAGKNSVEQAQEWKIQIGELTRMRGENMRLLEYETLNLKKLQEHHRNPLPTFFMHFVIFAIGSIGVLLSIFMKH